MNDMNDIPKLKKRSDRRNRTLSFDKATDDLYILAKQNGYDSSEIARQAVAEKFKALEPKLKRAVN